MHYLLLFADAADAAGTNVAPAWLREVLQPQILVFMVPLSAICGGIIFSIVKAVIKHRERMAKIEQGIDPDAPNNNPH